MKKFQKTETERTAQVTGFKNEAKVMAALVEFSQANNLGLKIFPGVEITNKKTGPLSAAFSSPDELGVGKSQSMEIDVVAIGKSAIYLLEIKSSIEAVLVGLFKSIEFAFRTKLQISIIGV